jgi:hypothetical protein
VIRLRSGRVEIALRLPWHHSFISTDDISYVSLLHSVLKFNIETKVVSTDDLLGGFGVGV